MLFWEIWFLHIRLWRQYGSSGAMSNRSSKLSREAPYWKGAGLLSKPSENLTNEASGRTGSEADWPNEEPSSSIPIGGISSKGLLLGLKRLQAQIPGRVSPIGLVGARSWWPFTWDSVPCKTCSSKGDGGAFTAWGDRSCRANRNRCLPS